MVAVATNFRQRLPPYGLGWLVLRTLKGCLRRPLEYPSYGIHEPSDDSRRRTQRALSILALLRPLLRDEPRPDPCAVRTTHRSTAIAPRRCARRTRALQRPIVAPPRARMRVRRSSSREPRSADRCRPALFRVAASGLAPALPAAGPGPLGGAPNRISRSRPVGTIGGARIGPRARHLVETLRSGARLRLVHVGCRVAARFPPRERAGDFAVR